MAHTEDLGPFNPHLHLLPLPGSGKPIECDILDSITREIDLVENAGYLALFMQKYRAEIINSEDALRSVLGYSIANMVHQKDDFARIVIDLCEQYDLFLGRTALNKVDIGNMFGFIRDFRHVSYSTRIIIPCFLARLHLVKKEDDLNDVRNVVHNNIDVLEMLYADEDMENYAQEISEAVDRILSI
ncbi:MAG: hypothetical protein ABI810_16280 [Sphingomonas bacterium]